MNAEVNSKSVRLVGPHRLAIALVATVFPLIWVGGLVTTYDAGMAVYDWPTSFGYNMFLYPISTWLAGPWNQFIEHGHRLLGAASGMITIAFLAAVFLSRCSKAMKVAAVVALVLIVGQGLLGGMRVRLNARHFALIHGCVGPLFFAYCAGLALTTSRWWTETPTISSSTGNSLRRAAWTGAAMAYLQLVIGAHLRHPADDGSPRGFQIAVLFHVITAVALFAHIIGLTWQANRLVGQERPIRFAASALSLLLVVQLALGVATWFVKYGRPNGLTNMAMGADFVVTAKGFWSSMIVTGHVANGSLILAMLTVLGLMCGRRFGFAGGATKSVGPDYAMGGAA